ncbi:unnamed protein product [Effrenium voratum]|uniref:Uncharacterized protein n=1 Tax=Effrenium voratum TaxID=2562239 RepID=A0AA36MRL4_9DINO|nr:unnamed protein product [Effrenium voratum]
MEVKNGFQIRTEEPRTKTREEGWPAQAQLALKVSHLEADVQLLRQRKEDLEHENEALAAAARRPDLEQKLKELKGEVAALRKQKELELQNQALSASDLERRLADSEEARAKLEERSVGSTRRRCNAGPSWKANRRTSPSPLQSSRQLCPSCCRCLPSSTSSVRGSPRRRARRRRRRIS